MESPAPLSDDPVLLDEVLDALELVRPVLEADGGAVEVVSIEAGIVSLRMLGACATCSASTLTLKATIERVLRREVPDVQAVRAVPTGS